MSERRAAWVQHNLALQIATVVKQSGVSLREALEARRVPYNYSSVTRVLSGERAVRLPVLFALADAFELALPVGGAEQASDRRSATLDRPTA